MAKPFDAAAVRATAFAVVCVALGTALAPFTSFPVGIARVNPTQHFVNVVAGVLLGPWWSVGIAFIIGLIRNALGLGTVLAFPGGMIGALLCGLAWRAWRKLPLAAAGEIVGTGLVAPAASSLLVAPAFMGKSVGILALLPSFLASSAAGAVLAVVVLSILSKDPHVSPLLRKRVPKREED